MAKTRVAVLFGGVSSEHEVSLMSATNVIRSIPKEKYEVICIGITKKGRWLYFPGDVSEIASGAWETNPDCTAAIISQTRFTRGLLRLKTGKPIIKRLMLSFRCCMAETAKTADYRDYWNWQSCRTLDAVL